MSAQKGAGIVLAGLAEYVEAANIAGRARVIVEAPEREQLVLRSESHRLKEVIPIYGFRRGEIFKIHAQRITQW